MTTTPIDTFEITVPVGVRTLLPNGRHILVNGPPGTAGTGVTVRGRSTEHDGPIIEIVGYGNSAGWVDPDPLALGVTWHDEETR